MISNNGKRLKKARKTIGITQYELSNKSGINIGSIKAYEQGIASINNASVSRVMRLAKALGVEITDILDTN